MIYPLSCRVDRIQPAHEEKHTADLLQDQRSKVEEWREGWHNWGTILHVDSSSKDVRQQCAAFFRESYHLYLNPFFVPQKTKTWQSRRCSRGVEDRKRGCAALFRGSVRCVFGVLFLSLFLFLNSNLHFRTPCDREDSYKLKTPFLLGFFNKNGVKKLVGGEGLEPPTFWV